MSAPPYSPEPAPPAPEPRHQPSLENLLLRFGLVTLDQLGAAMREQTETGTPFTESLVRDGIVSGEDLARVADRAPAMPAPAPAPDRDEIVVAPEPAAPVPAPPAHVALAEPEPDTQPLAAGFVVRGRLVNGEDVEIATVDDAAAAQRIARDAMRACARANGSDWPVLNGRYVRPEAIVSIEVAEAS